MSGSARKRVSKWDTKEEDTQHLSGDDYIEKSGSYFREKDPRFYPEGNGRNGSRRSGQDDEDEHLKSRQQHSGEAWPTRSRVSHEDDHDAMMGYYDPRKSSEQDESRQQYFRQSPSRDRSRTRRSGSRSNSRSRSRSPLKRVRRDEGGSFDRHKTRARVSPRPGREFDGSRYNRADDYDWDAKNRKTRDTKYYTEDSREQQHPGRVSGRSDYSSDFQEDNHNPRRREFPEGEFNRTANVPCRFFASGYCRNGNNCKFSHHGGGASARGSPERKPQEEMFSRQESYNHNGTTERMRNSHRWNDIERSDAGKSSEVVEVSRVVGKGMAETKGNNGSWIDDMEMSPDWNYGVKTSKNPANEERGVLKDTLAPAYEHGSGNQRSVSMFPTVGEKTVAASSHHNFSNNLVNTAPPVQGFNQNIENHSAVPYQSTPIAIGGSQVPLSTVTNLPSSHHSCSNNLVNTAPPVQPFNQNMENHSAVPVPYQSTPLAVGGSQVPLNLPGGLSSSNPENGNAQNTVSMEELNRISNISASLKQLFGNGQPIPLLQSTLNPKQTMQVPPEVYVQKEQPLHTQSDLPIDTGGVPAVTTALQINNRDAQEVKIPKTLVSLAGNPKAASTEDKNTDKEGIKTDKEEEETAEDTENVVEEEEEEENNKKEKDPKGMRAFKFALVEIVKELLKPAWKEGGMNKDAYKNIVKKVVDKVTGAIQSGNIPQTQEKIDHYLSASKPKLTKLVQAYVSKVKKS